MNQKTEKTKNRIVIGLLGITMIVSTGVLLPPHAFAQSAFNKVYDQAEKDCEKIAERFGKPFPSSLAIGGVGIDTYSVGCGFKSEDSLQIEDIRIVIDSFGLSRYSTPEAARNSIRRSVEVYPLKHKTNTTNSDIVATMEETPDGSVYLLKSYLVSVWPELRKTHTAKVAIVKGSCIVSVTSYSTYKEIAAGRAGYHVSDPQTYKTINKHPEFNHDREADMLESARQKAEEVFGMLDCGDSVPVQPAVNAPANNAPASSPYAVCTIKCLDEVDRRYQCPLPSTIIDDQGLSVIKLPDGTTRAFSPSGNKCVDDRGKAQNDCLFQCPAAVGGEPIPDPMGDGQPIKVAGAASDDPLNEAEKYINLLKRKPALPNKEEDLKKVLGDYEAGKPMSVWSVEGEPEMQVPGSDEWVILKKGDVIPKGARIFTGMDDDILVVLPGSYVVKVRGFSDITFNQTGISKALGRELINHLDLRNGDVEVQVEKGTYQGSMQVQMPQMVAGVRGTHFWVSYDETKRLGAVGVYKGEVAVDDLFRGTRTLLTPAKDETPRVIVMSSADSASAQDQKSAQGNPQLPAQKQSSSGAWWIVLIIVLGGGVFVLEKTGKLQLMLQKILILIRKDKSKQF